MEKYYAQWLCSVPGISNAAMRRIRQACGSLAGALEASEEALKEILTAKQLGALLKSRREIDSRERLAERFLEMNRGGIFFTCRGEPDFPSKLIQIPDSPEGIYYRGKLPEERLSVAVVGARDCSEYGARVAEELGRYLGEQGVQVISGMARGIDGISQAAALSAGGGSFAVLGSGVDVCYPASNRALYENLLERGGILSAYPPGTAPLSTNFPPRNRIVSGLADALVVVEAREKSGTLITVDMALEQGREVYVAPGRITDRLSDGCNRLLRQGAGVFLSPGEFLAEIQPAAEPRAGQLAADTGQQAAAFKRQAADTGQPTAIPERPTAVIGQLAAAAGRQANAREDEGRRQTLRELPAELEEIYLALDDTPDSLERIAARVRDRFSPVQVNTLLMRLCAEGLAVQVSPGHFRRQGMNGMKLF